MTCMCLKDLRENIRVTRHWHLLRKTQEDFGQAFVDLKKSHEEDLSMGKITKEIIFEVAFSGIFLSKDWVDKYITEMKTHGCSMLSCMG